MFRNAGGRVTWLIAVFAAAMFGAGCVKDGGPITALQGKPSFPPDRSAWLHAAPEARAAHARALHAALEAAVVDPVKWTAAGASGTITVVKYAPAHGTFCGAFTDQIVSGGATVKIYDLACWGDGWELIRDPKPVPVLGPAFAQADRVYVIRRGGSLADVARVTKTSLADLERLNPAYPKQLSAGTKVLLP